MDLSVFVRFSRAQIAHNGDSVEFYAAPFRYMFFIGIFHKGFNPDPVIFKKNSSSFFADG
jgi:hypothetical protein